MAKDLNKLEEDLKKLKSKTSSLKYPIELFRKYPDYFELDYLLKAKSFTKENLNDYIVNSHEFEDEDGSGYYRQLGLDNKYRKCVKDLINANLEDKTFIEYFKILNSCFEDIIITYKINYYKRDNFPAYYKNLVYADNIDPKHAAICAENDLLNLRKRNYSIYQLQNLIKKYGYSEYYKDYIKNADLFIDTTDEESFKTTLKVALDISGLTEEELMKVLSEYQIFGNFNNLSDETLLEHFNSFQNQYKYISSIRLSRIQNEDLKLLLGLSSSKTLERMNKETDEVILEKFEKFYRKQIIKNMLEDCPEIFNWKILDKSKKPGILKYKPNTGNKKVG